MKKFLLFVVLMAFFVSFEGMTQTCGQIGLIGEMTGWSDDIMMDRNPMAVSDFTTIITVTEEDDDDGDGFVQMKFRENSDWAVNWGSEDFPSGTAVQEGANIPVEFGTWYVMFNCETGDYSFTPTCGVISMIGEFNGWADDYPMMRDKNDPNQWTTLFTVTDEQDDNGDGFIEGKFRENADWVANWGGDEFPADTGYQDGPNIMIPLDTNGITTDYYVTFNCETGWYEFFPASGSVALIGEFNGWADDYAMMRNPENPNMWSAVFTVTDAQDDNGDGFIEAKFRENADWGVNWGGDDFPAGVAYQDGPNFMVPLDETGITTDYYVTFDYETGDYNFVATCGDISMIGTFIYNWNGDVAMNRDAVDPNVWTLTRSWYTDSEVKFRENADWTNNWGDVTFPTGTGVPGGGNIPLTTGTYDVSFNCETFAYDFVVNEAACGEIGMVGDFNEWGDDGTGFPTDIYLVRDPMYPSLFSVNYNFTSSTELLFRVDSDPLFQNVWGGTFPTGGGVFGDPNAKIAVPGGKYLITFNCEAGDFHFERLGSAIIAPEVFAINVDGELNETDWDLSQNVSQVIQGEPTEPINEVFFGTAWNAEYFYFGVSVIDDNVTVGDTVVVFLDGDKSGGDYDDHDAILIITGGGEFIPAYGPLTSIGAWATTDDGYSVEFAIPWADLGVTPETGGQAGVDVFVGDDDESEAAAYWLAWNGGLENYLGSTNFGDCVFGTLACGCISLYNETIGDMVLRNPTDMPTTYVATYEIFEGQLVVFRKDMNETVTWSATGFPSGTAEQGSSDFIPATPGRYRVTFDCLSGEYTFEPDETPDEGIAYADRTEEEPAIDGDLGEYTLNYTSNILASGTPINNTVTWGVLWDSYNLYLGVQVEDGVVEGSGNPWDNDAIEYYFDGNHDQDETYDGDFDTQLIQDFLSASTNEDTLWIKADGVQFTTDQFDAKWKFTTAGYNLELRLAWDIFDFRPGKGRTMGFSMGNNDSDNGIGRDYQSVWYGDGNNWNNTSLLGDIQLQGGPYFNVKDVFYNDQMVLFPNPTSGNVTIKTIGNVFQGEMTFYVSDISGRTILVEKEIFSGANDMITLHTDQLDAGVYFVNIVAADGKKAMKKLIIR